MATDYGTKLTALYNVLDQANTTTAAYDLSSGLTDRVQFITMDDPEVTSVRPDRYPCVFVWVNSASEEFEEIGTISGAGASTKRKRISFGVLGLIMKRGANEAHSTAMVDIYKLGTNIEAVLQRNVTLSSTAMWVNPANTEFLGPVNNGSAWIKGVRLDVQGDYIYR